MSNSESASQSNNQPRRLCTFMLGDLWLGTDIMSVEEAVRERGVTQVPRAHHTMAGVLNLRGRIISVIDARVVLGLPPRTDDVDSRNGPHLVVRTSHGSVSLMVDRFVNVIDVDDVESNHAVRTDAPPHLSKEIAAVVDAVHRLEPQLLLEVSLERLCAPAQTRQELTTSAAA